MDLVLRFWSLQGSGSSSSPETRSDAELIVLNEMSSFLDYLESQESLFSVYVNVRRINANARSFYTDVGSTKANLRNFFADNLLLKQCQEDQCQFHQNDKVIVLNKLRRQRPKILRHYRKYLKVHRRLKRSYKIG
ncbi:hypothetical protein B9Z55_025988 [Caenorhabditis nigoni]|uniref:Uncharacterized protein n=1 Tax=Caenorhabditis nigoni TaxID=1611254 RepID=A0A2G5T1B3_9PELO|nr:hypothetical protein B9Z55_025988 [Caenorhabditis nigoni]